MDGTRWNIVWTTINQGDNTMCIHINEESLTLNDLISDKLESFDPHEEMRQSIKDFLSKFYTWNEEAGEFDETPKEDYRPYEIKARYEDDCSDMTFVNIFSIRVSLPTDEDAKELADILDGEVVDGLNAGEKSYCITYTKKIVIKAKSREDAKRIFDGMEMREADRWAEFDKVKSITVKKAKK
jgi:hypothetical protein